MNSNLVDTRMKGQRYLYVMERRKDINKTDPSPIQIGYRYNISGDTVMGYFHLTISISFCY